MAECDEPQLSLASYATIRASLEAGLAREEVFEREDVDAQTYDASDRAWRDRLELGRAQWQLQETMDFLEHMRDARRRIDGDEGVVATSDVIEVGQAAEVGGSTSLVDGLGSTVSGVISPLASALPFRGHSPGRSPSPPTTGGALPFRTPEPAGARPSEPTRLNLDQFASLVAELTVTPERRQAILSRYGFDEGAFAAERASWEARWASVPLERTDFERQRKAFVAWLSTRPS